MLKPQTGPTREIVNLDGVWRFAVDDRSVQAPWTGDLGGTLDVAVPASYNDQFVDPAIRNHVGWVWYQRTVDVPRSWTGGRIMVRFDAATHEGRVYVDDTFIGEHIGGYTPFEFDVTELVERGTRFRLTVGVNNELTEHTVPPGHIFELADGRRKQQYHHDFFNYAGLARSVMLLHVPDLRVTDVTVITDIDGADGLVGVDVSTSSAGTVRLALRDESGAVVAEGEGATTQLRVPEARLWQAGAAYLYELDVVVLHPETGDVDDTYTVNVGIRTVEVRGTQFLLNGEPFYFTGFGKHEDTAVRGKGHDNAYLVHDFQLMDWVGANSFRTSHYPYAEEVLDYADRHGIIVIDETSAVGFNLGVAGGMSQRNPPPTFSPETLGDRTRETHAQHLRELIARDKNHPSVVMWCIANEPAGQEDGAREYFEPLTTLSRELDPTRPVTYTAWLGAHSGNDQIADLFDVIGINRYFGWYIDLGDLVAAEEKLRADIEGWIERYQRPVFMMEYGADTMAGLHAIDAAPWSEEYQKAYLEMHHRVFDDYPEFVGEHVWNFADFRTGAGLHRVGGNKKGIFTRDRQPKAAAHSLRERWTGLGGQKPGTAVR
jgi:beta-glucuronidase